MFFAWDSLSNGDFMLASIMLEQKFEKQKNYKLLKKDSQNRKKGPPFA